jgi:arylsulfatase A-like enzyme
MKLTTRILALFSSLVVGSAGAAETPNIVIILVDDMGYGDPGCFNPDSKIPTPNIDSLARDGMRFTDAHAPGPLCHMSRYGLMTGRYPFRTDVNKWRKHATIEPGRTTIASLLKAQGYQTAMVGKWHLGFEEDGYDKILPGGPVDVGFDSFFGIRASTDIPDYFYIRDKRAVAPPTEAIGDMNSPGDEWTRIQGKFWRRGKIGKSMKLEDVTPRFTEEAISVIEKQGGDKPLMLYLAYPAPHTPWLPSEEFVGKSKVGLYGDFMMMVDAMIGRVLGALEKSGMAQDTLVIFSSDNGPVWYDKDVERFGHDSAGPLRGMKADAWEAGHRMPFIVRWPGKVAAAAVSDQTICFTDLLATFANITGYQREPGEGPDSYDFSRVLLGGQPADKPVRPHLAMKSGGGHMSIRVGDWKLIDALGSGGFSDPKKLKPEKGAAPAQLYNLKDDLGEENNLFSEHSELVERLRATLKSVTGSDPAAF